MMVKVFWNFLELFGVRRCNFLSIKDLFCERKDRASMSGSYRTGCFFVLCERVTNYLCESEGKKLQSKRKFDLRCQRVVWTIFVFVFSNLPFLVFCLHLFDQNPKKIYKIAKSKKKKFRKRNRSSVRNFDGIEDGSVRRFPLGLISRCENVSLEIAIHAGKN